MTESILILGTDEAGYGPNLGPLTVGASQQDAPTVSGPRLGP